MLSEPELTAIAQALHRSEAIRFGEFTLKSGVVSPYYIDLAQLLSRPTDLNLVVRIAAKHLGTSRRKSRFRKIVSIELRGALLAIPVAQRLKLPCIVIRKQDKSYGIKGRIVGGTIQPHDRVVLFDDVITDGASKLDAIKAVEEGQGEVVGVFVVVDREQDGAERLAEAGYNLDALTTVTRLTNTLNRLGILDDRRLAKIRRFTARFTSP